MRRGYKFFISFALAFIAADVLSGYFNEHRMPRAGSAIGDLFFLSMISLALWWVIGPIIKGFIAGWKK